MQDISILYKKYVEFTRFTNILLLQKIWGKQPIKWCIRFSLVADSIYEVFISIIVAFVYFTLKFFSQHLVFVHLQLNPLRINCFYKKKI